MQSLKLDPRFYQSGSEVKLLSDQPLQIRNTALPMNNIVFHNHGEIARVGKDGVLRFTVDANDENAAKFIACIETVIGRRVTGVSVDSKELQPSKENHVPENN